MVGRTWLADGLDRAEEFAEPEGRNVPLPDGPAADALVADVLVADVPAADVVAADVPAGAVVGGLDRSEPEAVAVGEWVGVAGPDAGLNVATDSMAPATRQTARMLASSGITVPWPPNGPVSLRSQLRRRWARSSRW